MGEIAEGMLDGTFCQQCGEVMNEGGGPGYPQTCRGCRGTDARRQSDMPWFRVHNEKGLSQLERKLKSAQYNTWSEDHRDKNRNPISILSWDRKPDSDWSRPDKVMGVWFINDELAKRGMAIVEANSKSL